MKPFTTLGIVVGYSLPGNLTSDPEALLFVPYPNTTRWAQFRDASDRTAVLEHQIC